MTLNLQLCIPIICLFLLFFGELHAQTRTNGKTTKPIPKTETTPADPKNETTQDPTNLKPNSQSGIESVTGDVAVAFAKAGLAALAIIWNRGKVSNIVSA